MAHPFVNPRYQFLDSNGEPLAAGKLYTYEAGTSTPLATYTDRDEGTTNDNPLILDSEGVGTIWLGSGSYKLVLKDSNDVTLWTQDGVAHNNANSITLAMMPSVLLHASTAGRARMEDGFLSATSEGRAKMEDGFITLPKLADGILTADTDGRAKMADGFLTQAKRAALGQQVSSSCGTYSRSVATFGNVTNLSVSITTTGRPVFVGMIPAGGEGSQSYISIGGPGANTPSTLTGLTHTAPVTPDYAIQDFVSSGAGTAYGFASKDEGNSVLKVIANLQSRMGDVEDFSGAWDGLIQILRDSTSISELYVSALATRAAGSTVVSPSGPWTIDVPAAGTYTYLVQAKVTDAAFTIGLQNWKLIAFEL